MEMKVFFPGGKRVDAQYKEFTIRTDQPKENGGEGSDPAPFDLFLASIGTCAGIYVLSFCQQRDIPTEKITLLQTMHRNEETKLVDTITIQINVPPDFPEKYRNALIRSAELCAVKKHLFQPPEFVIQTNVVER